MRLIVFFLLFITGCTGRNANQINVLPNEDYTKEEKSLVSYPQNGRFNKYLDVNYEIVYDTSDYYYVRSAFYSNGIICPDSFVQVYNKAGDLRFSGRLLSESPQVFNGLCIWAHDSGHFKEISLFEEGKKIGRSELYKENGNLDEISYYIDNKLNGYRTSFHNNGVIKEHAFYIDNNIEGSYYSFYENSRLESSGNYSNGRVHGEWIYIDSNGIYQIEKEITYRIGAICNDGWRSHSTGRGTCSHHGGVDYWLTESHREVTQRGYYNDEQYHDQIYNYMRETFWEEKEINDTIESVIEQSDSLITE